MAPNGENSYYRGIEDVLDEHRTLTIVQGYDQADGGYLHCIETDYHVAREAIGMILSKQDQEIETVVG